MATNPARPQFQDTIDEAWGDQVADHVIRRYVDAAARDADLAGIAGADLAGQVVAIVPGGSMPYLQQHDGTAWVNMAGPIARAILTGPALTSGTWASINLNSLEYASGGLAMASDKSGLVLPYAGLWEVHAAALLNTAGNGNLAAATGNLGIAVGGNQVRLWGFSWSVSQPTISGGDVLLISTPGQTLKVQVIVFVTGAYVKASTPGSCYLSVAYRGPVPSVSPGTVRRPEYPPDPTSGQPRSGESERE